MYICKTIIGEHVLTVKMIFTNSFITYELEKLIGKVAAKNIAAGTEIYWAEVVD